DGAVFRCLPVVPALHADDLDVRDARPAAGGTWPRGGSMKPRTPYHGLMAEFETAEQLLAATRRARQQGYRNMDAYSPYPVEGLAIELGMVRTSVPFVVLVGGLVGAAAGFFMQYWSMAVDYPFNVGGRPTNSWPVWIPITFEIMVLVAAL